MTRIVATGVKITQLAGLLGTNDLTEWEKDFVASINNKTRGGKDCAHLTEPQLESIERIWKRHFA